MSIGTSSFTFKKGDTFTSTVRWRPRKDGIQNLIGASVISKIKDYKSSYFDLTCTLAEDGMSILVVGASTLTDDFSLGVAKWDVRIDIGGVVIHTPTIQFVVVDEVTQKPTT